MRTRTTVMLPAVVATALLLASCSSSDDAAGDASTGGVDLVSAGTLTLCTNPPFEPFVTEEDGEIGGLDVALATEVADDLGVQLTVRSTAFEGLQSGADLDTGACDIIAAGITITPERAAKIDFSEPYFDADQGLLVPEGSDLDSAESLAGKKVGVQQATTGETWAQDNGLETIQFEDLGLQIQALKTGQIDAAVNDVAVLGTFVGDGYEISANFSTGEQYGIGVKQGNTAMLDAVNSTLDRIRADGTYDALYTEYIGAAPSDTGASTAPSPSDG
ncbi:MAG TPA: ABC transporter substrate-binding protein [Cellulomonas sp.]